VAISRARRSIMMRMGAKAEAERANVVRNSVVRDFILWG
jgi:hypothetical protein